MKRFEETAPLNSKSTEELEVMYHKGSVKGRKQSPQQPRGCYGNQPKSTSQDLSTLPLKNPSTSVWHECLQKNRVATHQKVKNSLTFH